MYKYLFGPVPSRRLGMSLGIDLVPKKVCSLDCVYCEVGKTTKLTVERMEYIPCDRIISELKHYFDNNPDPDYITFSGSGEPTLNVRIGDIISFIKGIKPDVPVAVLTNGTLLWDKRVREDIVSADLVLPSLDAATADVFKKINRHEESLDVKRHIEGLVEFRKEFAGRIWLEVFILPGYNDTYEELAELKKAIIRIRPDSVQLNSLDRPGTLPGLKAAKREELQKILDLWGLENGEVIVSAPKRKELRAYRKDAENAILNTIRRRPCTADDLAEILGMHINEINKYLDVLEAEGRIKAVMQDRGAFYQENKEINGDDNENSD